jgi:hypothetical protein
MAHCFSVRSMPPNAARRSCRWTRERIAAWVADPDVPQDESLAHH